MGAASSPPLKLADLPTAINIIKPDSKQPPQTVKQASNKYQAKKQPVEVDEAYANVEVKLPKPRAAK